MDTGKLTRRVQIQTASTEQDSFGQPKQTWTPVYNCWAAIDIVRGQLIYSTAEFVAKATQQITIRYTCDVTFNNLDRIVYVDEASKTTHTYEIQTVINPGQGNVWLTFLAYEINPQE